MLHSAEGRGRLAEDPVMDGGGARCPGAKLTKLSYPTVEFVLHAVAVWINKRRVNGVRDEFGAMQPGRRNANSEGSGHSGRRSSS